MSYVQQCFTSSTVCTPAWSGLEQGHGQGVILMGDLFLGVDGAQGSMLVLFDMLLSFDIKELFEQHQGPSRRGGFICVCWTDCRVNTVPSLLLFSVHTQVQSTERCETQCAALPITHWHGSVLCALPHWGNLWQPHQDLSLPGGMKQIEEEPLLPTKHRDDGSVCDRRGILTIKHILPSFDASDYQPSKQALTFWSCWTANSSLALRSQKRQGKYAATLVEVAIQCFLPWTTYLDGEKPCDPSKEDILHHIPLCDFLIIHVLFWIFEDHKAGLGNLVGQ